MRVKLIFSAARSIQRLKSKLSAAYEQSNFLEDRVIEEEEKNTKYSTLIKQIFQHNETPDSVEEMIREFYDNLD